MLFYALSFSFYTLNSIPHRYTPILSSVNVNFVHTKKISVKFTNIIICAPLYMSMPTCVYVYITEAGIEEKCK